MLNIGDLYVTQHDVRHLDEIPAMVDYVIEGGLWTKDLLMSYAKSRNIKPSPLIQISLFPDKKHFIHDGHHRILATFQGGRDYLYDTEYVITNWTYEQYTDVNIKANWYTPFDPRIECRKADLSAYKHKIIQLIENKTENIEQIIFGFNEFKEPRRFNTIKELYSELRKSNEKICSITDPTLRELESFKY